MGLACPQPLLRGKLGSHVGPQLIESWVNTCYPKDGQICKLIGN
jgi:hypothetical protein